MIVIYQNAKLKRGVHLSCRLYQTTEGFMYQQPLPEEKTSQNYKWKAEKFPGLTKV